MFREQMDSVGDRQEIAFFDLETTVPSRALLEFGAILVCPRKLVELDNYSTLVRPANLFSVPVVRCNGITRDAVESAPTFTEIADKVYDILHGRFWAGHNIVEFDCVLIREAFAEIGRPAPEPKGTIDSYELLKQRFGPRAGNMKMATLATYFGLGQQTHRSLDDVRMNLEVLKYCATVLFLESSMEERPVPESTETYSAQAEGCSGYAGFLELEEVSIPSLTTSLAPSFRGSQRIQILHRSVLQLCCMNLRVRFGVREKFYDHAGRPRLSIVLDTSPSLCCVLDACDDLAQKLSLDSGSTSKWRPVVRKNAIRLHIPIVANGDIYATEMYQREASGNTQRLVFSGLDATELGTLFVPGSLIDAYFSLDSYDYQQKAGIRLVAKRLIIQSN